MFEKRVLMQNRERKSRKYEKLLQKNTRTAKGKNYKKANKYKWKKQEADYKRVWIFKHTKMERIEDARRVLMRNVYISKVKL